ncbi:MAG: hypothetical protein KatS3mg103_0126 [Phycisphaerales bacterium]|nr:MAG: hypothetical protein KatS3mg103_0126 [Phycisphaerales bacterium]
MTRPAGPSPASAGSAVRAMASADRADRRTALVVGGGLAGIAAAVMLADEGVAVTLLEARRRLGGRAGSFEDPRTGEVLDNCQHVAMGACRVYRSLLDRLGVADRFAWTGVQTWIEPGGRRSRISPVPGLGRWAFGPSLLAARFLSWADKRSVMRAVRAAAGTDRSELAGISFHAWLERTGPTHGALARLWSPVIVSACNLPPERVSAQVGLHVLQGALLGGAHAGRIGVPRCPLGTLYEPVEAILRRAGGRVVLGARVRRLQPGMAICADGRTFHGQAVVCALDPASANRLVSIDGRPPFEGVGFSPILGVHLRYDRPVLDVPHAVLVDGAVQWVFARHGDGAHLHAGGQRRGPVGGPGRGRDRPGGGRRAGRVSAACPPGPAAVGQARAGTAGDVRGHARVPAPPAGRRPADRPGVLSCRGRHLDGLAGDDGRGRPQRPGGGGRWALLELGRSVPTHGPERPLTGTIGV